MSKKRYHTEIEILRDIDKWKSKMEGLKRSADALDLKASELFKLNDPALNEDAKYARAQAEKKRRSAYRLEMRKLVHLKNKLAEFRTPMLPAISNGDKSIQAT